MLHEQYDRPAESRRNPALWWLLGALVVAQLIGLWQLCSHQVQRAQDRNSEAQMAQAALADCLQYIPGSTLGSCTARLGLASNTVPQPENNALEAGNAATHTVSHDGAAQRATPVSFSYR